ncbi:MAG: hypothetical protein EOP86_04920 [Verrucomicrobiaceae bacterium]|nr:MAG: hypothetical protein EOP86_04920 [Verrucomicrobiaceae bacterium]
MVLTHSATQPCIPAIHAGGDDWITRHLEEELEQTRRRLRDTEEQHRASIEEMKAGNEELQAMNEELRSAGEELVTSREELQSVNEELQTVNQELKSRVEELSHTNSDLQNLMAATDIATVFLDRDLRIKRYTPSAVALFNFIPGDLGRPLLDLTHRLDYPDIDTDARRVLETLAPAEREACAGERWYLARMQPYRTVEDRIAGVVLTFVEITERRAAAERLREGEQRFRSLVESRAQAVREMDPDALHLWRNHRRLTERESRHLDLLARQAADLIEQRLAFTEIQAAYPETESADRAKDHFLAVPSHELRTPLTPVLMALDNILHGGSATLTPFLRDALEMALRNVELEARLIDDLMDMTRIKQGKLEIARSRVDIHEILRRTLEICQPDLMAKKHRTELDNGAALHWLEGDATRLQQLFWNLIQNACKFTLPHGDILIVTRNPAPGVIKITVSDTGTGIKPKALECIFEPFIQADSQVARQFGGLGLGLAICKAIAEAHGGVLSAANAETGKGAVFTVILPVLPAG